MLSKIFRIRKYPSYIRQLWWQLTIPRKLRRLHVHLGSGVIFYGSPIVSMEEGRGEITIGTDCVLCSVSEYTALGVNHPVVLRTLRPGAVIKIGDNTGMSGATICAAVSIVVGSNVLLGANVTIVDTDFHAVKPKDRRQNDNPDDISSKPVIIGNNVFIGMNTLVLKGSRIGENSVIGAGSIVIGEIPANVIAAGNPARVIKTLS
jgi:acetyltransferase-like isoleucine patch superfamily enzyme